LNPFLGILLHGIGGFFHGSFYFPLTKIKGWSWESYWLLQGVVAWVVSPILISFLLVPDLIGLFSKCTFNHLFYPSLFGFLWGIGSLTFGMTMRFLGMSMGMSVALGFCTSFGTLIPPIYAGDVTNLFLTTSGLIILLGVMICLSGIGIVGYAGSLKEKELSDAEKRAAIKEFALTKGIFIAVFSGIMSACFAFGIQAGHPVATLALEQGTASIFQNSPVFILVMGSGFFANSIWCIVLSVKNKSFSDFANQKNSVQIWNYSFAIIGGLMWYIGFFFYGMGTTFMGRYDFTSWSIHMAFVIFFSNLFGIIAKEWMGVRAKTMRIVYLGMIILILSTLIIGYGNQVT